MNIPFWKSDIRRGHDVSKTPISVKKTKLYSKNIMKFSGHTMTVLPKGFFCIIGGYSNEKCRSDVYLCDAEEFFNNEKINVQWHEINFKGFPIPALASSCCCNVGNKVYVYGGSGPIWGRSNSDVFYEIDFTTRESKKINTINTPPELYGGTLNYYKDNEKLYLFGGTNGTFFFNSVYSFDLKKQIWVKEETRGEIPSARYKHDSLIIDGQLYILGGGQYRPGQNKFEIYKLDLETMTWCVVNYLSSEVDHQNTLASGVAFDEFKNEIIIFGGRKDDDSKGNKIYGFNIKSEKMREIPMNTIVQGREFHKCCIYKNKFFSIAGSTGTERIDEILVFNLD